MVFTASLLGPEHDRDGILNMSESNLVVSLGQAFNGMPPFLFGRHMVEPK